MRLIGVSHSKCLLINVGFISADWNEPKSERASINTALLSQTPGLLPVYLPSHAGLGLKVVGPTAPAEPV